MTKLMVKFHNAETGEEIEREMNAEELAQHAVDVANAQAERDAATALATKKQEVLAKLGLTADEVTALLA
jgi:hypothetical protein